MRRILRPALLPIAALLTACSGQEAFAPRIESGVSLGLNETLPIRISEFHYDNTGTDINETIEVSGPAGADLTGWTIVLYNGSGGALYDTDPLLPTLIPASCGSRGVVTLSYPSNGIQNGSPDGIALVNSLGVVVEFLSYEGAFTAVGGPANGMTSTDIGVSEDGTGATNISIKRVGATTTWSAPSVSSFGVCNDDIEPPPVVVATVEVTPASATIVVGGTRQFTATAFDNTHQQIAGVVFTWSSSLPSIATVNSSGLATGVATGDAVISATAPNAVFGSAQLHVDPAPPPGGGSALFSEIHYDNTGADVGEAVEIEGEAGTSLTNWSIVLYNGNGGASYATIPLAGVIANQCNGRGTVFVAGPASGIQNGNPDGFVLVNSANQVVEFLSYGGTFAATNGPASGMTSTDIGVAESGSTAVGRSLQRDDDGTWFGPVASSFGTCNPPPPPPALSIFGRLFSDPPLPVGFEDQLFAEERNASGQVIPTTMTWSSETPLIASIDQDGVMHAIAAGNAIFRATATDGTTGTISLPMAVATLGGTAQYGNNIEFGQPADGNAADDIIVNRSQLNTSFNPLRGIPNWVSYNLEASHFGAQDRCECFTFDPQLVGLTSYTTADYTGGGDPQFSTFRIDRGHLARSFDRTSGALDNAYTYLFTNIIPQASDNNQGPWAIMENFLGDQARFQNKEVYVIAGASGSQGTVKNEGKITIPLTTWKVAVIMDRDEGLAQVQSRQDIEVIAVIMPNTGGIRNVDWNTYRTTVDAVEALSGYDVLSLLPDQIEIAVESMTSPPNAAEDGPFGGNEGTSIAMSGAGSTDPDAGDVLTYAWNFGDGSTGAGAAVSHTYAQDGVYTVQLTVTDSRGLTSTVSTTATIANVAPAIAVFAGAVLFPGETYAANGSFTDPGADVWLATVNFGDGTGVNPLTLSGKTFGLSHVYASAGGFTVTVRVSDDDVTSTRTQTVTVLTTEQGVTDALGMLAQLVTDGKLSESQSHEARNALEVALKAIEDGKYDQVLHHLDRVLSEVDSLVSQGRLAASDSAALLDWLTRIRASVAG